MALLGVMLGLAAVAVPPAPPASSEMAAAGPAGPLRGSFVGPAGKNVPVLLIIPGSGPTDRDGNNPLGVRGAPYRLLAEGLAAKGIASIRIDKRGMFGSAGAVADANAVTIDDYVRDVGAWIDAARQRTGAHCVWLLGHSEGGLVALAAAARQPAPICGLLLVAAAGRPLGDVLRQQLHANPANAPLLEAADKAIDALAAGQRVAPESLPPALAPLFRPEVQGFLISVMAQDPAALIAKPGKPVLILQGERDLQVDVGDAQALKRAYPAATLTLLPDMNHVLKQVASDDRAANIATYADPDLPLAPGIVDAVAAFVIAKAR